AEWKILEREGRVGAVGVLLQLTKRLRELRAERALEIREQDDFNGSRRRRGRWCRDSLRRGGELRRHHQRQESRCHRGRSDVVAASAVEAPGCGGHERA